ncbi:MAG: hypothetical protein FJ225_05275 [Lentisphaerae bacterium]|nr:hypothetical protein [Lentisphaerota bacterium]
MKAGYWFTAVVVSTLAVQCIGAESAVRPQDLLKETFHASVTDCGGWHFLLAYAASSGIGLAMARAVPGRRLGAWTVATDDTRLTVGATDEGQLCLYELSIRTSRWALTAGRR